MSKSVPERVLSFRSFTRLPAFVEMRDELFLIALVILAVGGFALVQPTFLSISNLLNIGQQSAIVAIVAFGMTGVIIGRGIDISVGGTLAACGIVAGVALDATGSGVIGIVASLLAGAVFGCVNAGLIAGLGVSPFIATLGTMALSKGAALSISKASSIPVHDPLMLWPGQASVLGIPAGFVIALVLCAIWHQVFRRTVFGRSIFAVGGNHVAARASLVFVKRTQSITYILCGMSAGLASIIGIGRLGSAQPLAGSGLEFAAITAAVVGGASLAGGKGSVAGTLLGAIAVGVISNGLAFLQFSQQIVYMVSGVLVLAAVIARTDLGGLTKFHFASRTAESTRVETWDFAHTSLNLKGLSKHFSGVQVLHEISFTMTGGEVIALMGENGAGKSTLVKCISGVYAPDAGEITIVAGPHRASSTLKPSEVAVIHQHFSLVPDLTVAESLSLGREVTRFGFLDRSAMRRRAEAALKEVGLICDVNIRVRELTVGERQMLEVAKALMASAWLIIMDEPTSALSNKERDNLYRIVRGLKHRGCCVLYISHKMEEVQELASRAVVLRDGKLVGDIEMKDISERDLIRMMVGRELKNIFPWSDARLGLPVLEVVDIKSRVLSGVTLSVREGEIVGLAGLMGSGRTEILRSIAGLDSYASGSIKVHGEKLSPGGHHRTAELGVAFIPEDRRLEGLVSGLSVSDNLGLVWMRRHNKRGILSISALRKNAVNYIRRLDIRPPITSAIAGSLSGGNQQKVVIGKWLAVNPRIILLDEPTSGVDVGAKSEIHKVIGELKASGTAILLVSSELPELLGVCDRVIVISEGRTVGEFPRGATEQEVMERAFSREGRRADNQVEGINH